MNISTLSYIPHKPVLLSIRAVSCPENGFIKPVARIRADASLAFCKYWLFKSLLSCGVIKPCLSSAGTVNAPISGIPSLNSSFAERNALGALFASVAPTVGSNAKTELAISSAEISPAAIEPT